MDKVQLKFDQTVKINEDKGIRSSCVSDDKKLAYISNDYKCTITVIDMNNKKKIALNLDTEVSHSNSNYCTFNLKGEFILYSLFYVHETFGSHDIIWIYSTQTKDNKWECKRFYRILKDYELVSISKYDKVYLYPMDSNDYIYEWNINTEKSVKIFVNHKDENEFKIQRNQIYKYKNNRNQTLFEKQKPNYDELEAFFSEQSSEQTDDEQTKFVLRILNGRVWKSKFMSKTNKNSDELSKENNKIIECDDVDKHLNVHSFNLYMDAVPTLFQKAITNDLHRVQKSTVSTENLIKWDMNINHIEINLAVFKKHNTEWNLVISRRIDNHHYKYKYSAITKINYELVI
ncbi:hypothetical protein RirG_251460 [Rhizophagus irregularis DAOM 197198w]|uniref:Uncharacterized protein n=3 Tax=Rhizophagus irregularis TaxID=588596 RepID=A0A015LCQ6_RHIIW|nr:hypothetical protein RirG_251460 [Rhizophagus irregularis DAOM 197198w]